MLRTKPTFWGKYHPNGQLSTWNIYYCMITLLANNYRIAHRPLFNLPGRGFGSPLGFCEEEIDGNDPTNESGIGGWYGGGGKRCAKSGLIVEPTRINTERYREKLFCTWFFMKISSAKLFASTKDGTHVWCPENWCS